MPGWAHVSIFLQFEQICILENCKIVQIKVLHTCETCLIKEVIFVIFEKTNLGSLCMLCKVWFILHHRFTFALFFPFPFWPLFWSISYGLLLCSFSFGWSLVLLDKVGIASVLGFLFM